MSDPFPKKIVRERLPMGSAFYGERLRDMVFVGGWGICTLREEIAGFCLLGIEVITLVFQGAIRASGGSGGAIFSAEEDHSMAIGGLVGFRDDGV